LSVAARRGAGEGRAVGSKGRPYRTVVVDGFEILIGRGSEENDELSLRVAQPDDVWLHVAGGTPGSHVVVRNPDRGDVPRAVVEAAASYAAWYSKARGAPRVEVHVCRGRDVSKPRGAPAGLVELARWKSMKVAPAQPTGGDEGDPTSEAPSAARGGGKRRR
jgi:predicted ribosome quality control (RQC) complex YloA/Tae2 family protein